jgi:hypothetical protein
MPLDGIYPVLAIKFFVDRHPKFKGPAPIRDYCDWLLNPPPIRCYSEAQVA